MAQNLGALTTLGPKLQNDHDYFRIERLRRMFRPRRSGRDELGVLRQQMGSSDPFHNGAMSETEVSGDLPDAPAGLNQTRRFHADARQTIVYGIHSHILPGWFQAIEPQHLVDFLDKLW